MTSPIKSQASNLTQVSGGSEIIIEKQIKIPKIGNSGTHGLRKGRGSLGCVYRRAITPAQTITKANNVPMLVICPSLEIGKNPAKMLIKNIKIKLERHGVFH